MKRIKLSKRQFGLIVLGLLVLLSSLFFIYFRQNRLGFLNGGPGQQPGRGQRPEGAQDFGGSPQTTNKPRWSGPIPTPPKDKITFYKGLWAGTWFYPEQYSGVKPEPEKYKSWGVNIVNIQPGFEINSRGETRYPIDYPTYEDLDAWFGQLAELFYKNNIHLAMTVMIHYKEEFVRGVDWGGETAYVPKEKTQSQGYFKNYDVIVQDMAKIAEKYHFDLFSPMGEPENVFLDAKLASDWNQQILPKIKKYYHGKVYYKGDLHKGQGNTMNFKGYDVLGMVTSPTEPQATKEELRKSFDFDMERVLVWAKRDGASEVVISEHGYLGENKMAPPENIGIVLEEGSKKLNGVFLTEPFPAVLKTTQGEQIVGEMKRWFLK
ncbi:MAG: hypothetical protein M1575_03545 [Patescibacteria group bacterium]|nr:hypothetical protein [Patescibacteria group bacterium]MCL5095773.1 hypothetical protein [Patescibacteria group bacterium]